MTFQKWLKTEQGRKIVFERNTLKMLEETWNAARMDAALNHDERAECAKAERDELQRAIMRLPLPPHEMGDGPDERVTNVLNMLAEAEQTK